MTRKYTYCLFCFFLAISSAFAQDLAGKVFIVQSKAAEAKGKVLDADYNDLGKNGSKVQLWDKKATPNQAWKFEAIEKETNRYYIVNQSPKAGKYKYLEAEWTTLGQDGGKVQLWELDEASNQRTRDHQIWRIIKNKDGSFSILSAHPKSNGKALEAESYSQQNNGGKIQLYFDYSNPNQTWNFIEVDQTIKEK